jgi:hypothetical protein
MVYFATAMSEKIKTLRGETRGLSRQTENIGR